MSSGLQAHTWGRDIHAGERHLLPTLQPKLDPWNSPGGKNELTPRKHCGMHHPQINNVEESETIDC